MPVRAKYVGPHDSVTLPDVRDDDGNLVTVERGHLLPDSVPAEVRDALLEQEDVWGKVQQPTPRKRSRKRTAPRPSSTSAEQDASPQTPPEPEPEPATTGTEG